MTELKAYLATLDFVADDDGAFYKVEDVQEYIMALAAKIADLEADKARLVGENLRLRTQIKLLKQEAADYW